MNSKRLISFLVLSTLLLTVPTTVFAQTATSVPSTAAKQGVRKSANLTLVQQKGDLLIQQRLTTLHTILTRISGLKRLTQDEKATLTTNINNDTTALTNLQAKIDADTDIMTARADVKSIYLTYRVYAEFDPQTALLAASDAMATSVDQFTLLAAKLQTRITQAASSGNTVTTLTALLAGIQNKTADAKNQYTTVNTDIASLTPASYNSNPTGTHQTFIASRVMLQTGRADLQTALQDAKQIIAVLKTFKTTVTGTPSATTATPTPTL